MTNGSPGRHSNKAFSIGSEGTEESEILFIEEAPSRPTPDPLGTLLTNCTEQTPLILPASLRRGETPDADTDVEDRRQEESPVAESHHFVVDVFTVNKDDNLWKQASRFAKYEEDCEGFDNHFGRPHVPCIPMTTYCALQQVAAKAILFPNVQYESLEEFLALVESKVHAQDVPKLGEIIKTILEKRIQYLEERAPLHNRHSASTQSLQSAAPINVGYAGALPRSLLSAPNNLGSLAHRTGKKFPKSQSGLRFTHSFLGQPSVSSHPLEPVFWDEDSELGMLLTAEVSDMTVCRMVAFRFEETTSIEKLFPNMTNIRHLFFIIGPALKDVTYLDMGRALASVVSNPSATKTFGRLKSPETITKAIDRFLQETVVIAPGRVDNRNLIPTDNIRHTLNMHAEAKDQATAARAVHPTNVDVERNAPKDIDEKECWLFSGVRSDLRNRSKYWWSDITDGLQGYIATVVLYMFCVTVVPTLTFGAIMGIGTDGILAVKDCLVSQAVSGFIWSVSSCQPLLIMSPTGPFLVFEKALYAYCKANGLDFNEVRFYTGINLFLITIAGAATNSAHLIRYVTIYTEDIFCALISLIFFFEVGDFLREQYRHNSIEGMEYYIQNSANCTGISEADCTLSQPNTFLLEVYMVILSVAVFHYLKKCKKTTIFKKTIRNLFANFGGIFAVILVSVGYQLLFRHIPVQMVDIPANFGENRPFEGYLFFPKTIPSAHTMLVSGLAALLLYVLIFVEVEIPEQMALRESRKLKKGGGLHWDLIVVGFCTLVSSFAGLPWMCPAAVQSLAHISSLTVYKTAAPGEKSKPSHVIEQRLSGFFTYCMLGAFVCCGQYFPIPSASIFGVFFYLGVRNLEGNRMMRRVGMWFQAAKHRGNDKFLDIIHMKKCDLIGYLQRNRVIYLLADKYPWLAEYIEDIVRYIERKVPFSRIVIFTAVQVAIVCGMFFAKSTRLGGLLFPVFIVATVLFVKWILPLFVQEPLLEALDGEDIENSSDDESEDFYMNTRIPV